MKYVLRPIEGATYEYVIVQNVLSPSIMRQAVCDYASILVVKK
jgi:hypothetical protein